MRPERGRPPRYEASLWHCGDSWCNCYQPQIILRTQNLTVGGDWDRLTGVWEGEFVTEATGDDIERLEQELQAECERRGIPLGVSVATDQPDDVTERVDREQMAEANRQFRARSGGGEV